MSADPMVVVTQHVGRNDKAGIMVGQVIKSCDPGTCQECDNGKVKILGRNYYGKVAVQHINGAHFRFTQV